MNRFSQYCGYDYRYAYGPIVKNSVPMPVRQTVEVVYTTPIMMQQAPHQTPHPIQQPIPPQPYPIQQPMTSPQQPQVLNPNIKLSEISKKELEKQANFRSWKDNGRIKIGVKLDLAVSDTFYVGSNSEYFDALKLRIVKASNLELEKVDDDPDSTIYYVKNGDIELEEVDGVKLSDGMKDVIKKYLLFDVYDLEFKSKVSVDELYLVSGNRDERIKAFKSIISNYTLEELDVSDLKILEYDFESVKLEVEIIYGRSEIPINLYFKILLNPLYRIEISAYGKEFKILTGETLNNCIAMKLEDKIIEMSERK